MTDGGLVFFVLSAPTLRSRLNVMVRVNGCPYNGRGRSVDLGASGATRAWLVVAGIDLPAGAVENVAVGRSASRAEVVAEVDLSSLIGGLLARQAAGVREQVIAVALAAAADVTMSRALSDDLRTIHEALREHRPRVAVDPKLPPGVSIEVLARLDATAVYLRGWIGYLDDELVAVTVVSPEGDRVEVGGRLHRFDRHDVAAFYDKPAWAPAGFGFACTVTLRTPSVSDEGWLVMFETQQGALFEAPATVTASELAAVREIVMADLVLESLPSTSFRSHHVWPAITRLQNTVLARSGIATIDQLGEPPGDPTVTVIVPLYRRIDFVQHQLAAFVGDPEFRSVDLIYVLDSPELADAFRAECRRLHRLYRVPFRAVVLQQNVGFSGANNAGAQIARGRLLLLLNSDVLPDRAGWLAEMVDFIDRSPNIGAVAPKLLFEDDSIQHAGLYFERPDGEGLWSNEHYFKGLHRSLPAACTTRAVPAVTAACMLIAALVYREVGGLLGQYVQGDFEDSDLCMRLRAGGRQVWYLADVELFHLEGQSYPTPARVANGQFNRWLHTHLWNDAITALMSDPSVEPGSPDNRQLMEART